MLRLLRQTLVLAVLGGTMTCAWAFSLRGPFATDPDGGATWQTAGIGYNPLGNDNGGPMNLGEGYRWNIPVITFGFDASFLHYFGPKGSNAIVEAFDILNGIRPFSKIKDSRLLQVPTDTTKANFVAASLGIVDLKSFALGYVVGNLGLASPDRYTWTLRDVRPLAPPPGNQYLVIQRNFDPIRRIPTPFVNDVLYTYAIVDPIEISDGGTYADAIEIPVDPNTISFNRAVASLDLLINGDEFQTFSVGNFYTGLTRDDIGGLRYLYSKGKHNSYVETLPPGITNVLAGTGATWQPVGGGVPVASTALRTGVDKIRFKVVKNESVFGPFRVITNTYTDSYFTNNFRVVKQRLQRVLASPDILFSAADLGLNAGGNPVILTRTTADTTVFPSNYVNNAAINTQLGSGPVSGPGQINPPIVITFNKIGPFIINQTPSFLGQADGAVGFTWGSFDGTTNDPIVYPQPPGGGGMTIRDLEQMIFTPF